jgi:hypothetical protein
LPWEPARKATAEEILAAAAVDGEEYDAEHVVAEEASSAHAQEIVDDDARKVVDAEESLSMATLAWDLSPLMLHDDDYADSDGDCVVEVAEAECRDCRMEEEASSAKTVAAAVLVHYSSS